MIIGVFMCEARGCCRRADWAYIGEGGDMFLCDFHGGTDEVEGWTRIEHVESLSPIDGSGT